jgi:hypothetical protein
MSHNIAPGPIAPYNNPPINPQYFQPSVFIISAISLGSLTTVTTTVNNNYVVGQLCRLLIPDQYGSRGLNEAEGIVINIPAPNQVTLNIYSVGVNPFIANPSYGPTKPQILAIGDYNSGIISATGPSIPSTTIPGAFINISPL